MVAALVVALPAIADEFSADAVTLGWLTTVFFLSAAVFLVPLGRIADMHGAKKYHPGPHHDTEGRCGPRACRCTVA
jgi:MFS family permease